MAHTKDKSRKFLSILLFGSVFTLAPYSAFASGGSGHGRGSDDSSHSEDSHHSSPSPSPSPSPSQSIESGSNEKTEVSDATTKSGFKIERKQKRKKGVVVEDKFEAALKLPVPTLSVGISTNSDAIAGDVSLKLSRLGVAFADCTLDFNSLKRNRKGFKAEYKVSIEEKAKKGVVTTKVKKGACDVDLVTDGVQSDLPNIQNGDTYVVEVNGISLISGSL